MGCMGSIHGEHLTVMVGKPRPDQVNLPERLNVVLTGQGSLLARGGTPGSVCGGSHRSETQSPSPITNPDLRQSQPSHFPPSTGLSVLPMPRKSAVAPPKPQDQESSH